MLTTKTLSNIFSIPSTNKACLTLYYSINSEEIETLNFVSYIPNQTTYSGITMTRLKTPLFDDYYINTTLLVEGYRMPPLNENSYQYIETYTVQINDNSNDNMFVATGTYNDNGTNLSTNNGKQTFPILNGTGIFKNYTTLDIQYMDNNKRIMILY